MVFINHELIQVISDYYSTTYNAAMKIACLAKMQTLIDDTTQSVLQDRLQDERFELQAHIMRVLLDADGESYTIIARQLKQAHNDSWLEQLQQLDLRELKPSIKRYQKVEAALCQLEIGLYGLCSDCEEPIEEARLLADPAEQRCESCDQRFHRRSHKTLLL